MPFTIAPVELRRRLTRQSRKLALLLLASGMALTGAQAAAAASAESPPSAAILLDGYPLPFPVAPVITQGTTMVPFRAIAEALQITVTWSEQTRTVVAAKTVDGSATTVKLRLNDKTADVNGRKLPLTVAPMSRNGSVLVPLSFFSSQFGASVNWDGATRTVSIQSPAEDMYTAAFYAIKSYGQVSLVNEFDSVSFGWARIDENGELTLSDKDFYWPQPDGDTTPETIVADAAAANTAPQLMVAATDVSGELTKLLTDASLRSKAIEGIVTLAADKHFQGITLDFEGLGLTGDAAAVQRTFNDFVRLLDERAEAEGLKLTLALHPLNGAYHGYDYGTLAKYADEIVIMAYQYSYETGPEPLNRVDEAIRLALKQVPKEKLLLGISMYSEDADSVGSKIGLAKRYHLKGVAIWRLGDILSDAEMAQIRRHIDMK